MYSIGSMIGNSVSVHATESATETLKNVIKEQIKEERTEILLHESEYPDLMQHVREGWIIAENMNGYAFRIVVPGSMFGKIVLKDRDAVIPDGYKGSVLVKLGDVWEYKTRSGKVLLLAREIYAVKESGLQITVRAVKNRNNKSIIALYKGKIVRFLGSEPKEGEIVTCKVFGAYERNLYVTF
ncbi:MAG: hypothetical protein ACP5FQ_05120 [Thermoplasmata archaeon]